jgi:hypothetical protein
MLDSSQPWHYANDGGGGRWSIPDASAASDQWLITPPLQVASSGTFGVSLRHRYSFESDSFENYDGGVIEISQDNGVTWSDIGTALTVHGYSGAVWALNEPLANRQAFVGMSDGYPNYDTTSGAFPDSYHGKTVQLRFRVGTDEVQGAPGWDLQGIQFTGIVNHPFPSRLPVSGCGVMHP